MSTFFNELEKETNTTLTDNGDKAYLSTLNANLDYFAAVGSLNNNKKVKELVDLAILENPKLATKNIFYTRDIKDGYGLRNNFLVSLLSLEEIQPDYLYKVLEFIPKHGRWDDIVKLFQKAKRDKTKSLIISILQKQLVDDLSNLRLNQPVSLLAKWLPTESSKNKLTKETALELGYQLFKSAKRYRKTVASLRKHIKIVETNLTNKDYTFDYKKVPGKALVKYKNAFYVNDLDRFREFLLETKKNPSILTDKMNKLYPYEIYSRLGNWNEKEENDLLNTSWESLPKESVNKRAIAVLDTSGSMIVPINKQTSVSVLDAASSLAIRLAERLEGKFKNKILSFSTRPQLLNLPEGTLLDKKNYLETKEEVSSTNIEKTYDLILKTSIKADKKDIPEMVVIISDMQFNSMVEDSVDETTFENISRKYAEAGLEMPKMIFWNMANNRLTFTSDSLDNLYLSGFSYNVFELIENGEFPQATDLLMKALSKFDYFDKIL